MLVPESVLLSRATDRAMAYRVVPRLPSALDCFRAGNENGQR